MLPTSTCLHNYRIGKLMGSGVYGKVSSACDAKPSSSLGLASLASLASSEEKCDTYVIKESTIANAADYVSALLDMAMLQRLQPAVWKNSKGETKPLVPRYVDHKFCGDKSFLVMERWDTDMEKLGKEQFGKFFAAHQSLFSPNTSSSSFLFYTVPQITDMFNIAKRLDELGVVEGDLKPSQLLYRESNGDMALTDWGLSLSFGWATDVNSTHCPDTDGGEEAIVPRSLRSYFSQWQLETYLTKYTPKTIVYDQKKNTLFLFGGIKDFPLPWREALHEVCPGFVADPMLLDEDLEKGRPYLIHAAQGRVAPTTGPVPKIISLKYLKDLKKEVDEHRAEREYFDFMFKKYLDEAVPT